MKIFNTFIQRYLLNFDYKRLIQLGWVRSELKGGLKGHTT
jgi:hypothetical protein